MDLRVHNEILDYFSHIGPKYSKNQYDNKSEFQDFFDWFYVCLLVGLLFNIETGPPPVTETREMMKKTFPNRFLGPIRSILISLLINNEIDNNQKRDSTRVELSKFINSYLDDEPNSKLSSAACTRMMAYAWGGFKKIKKEYPNPPGNFQLFINNYVKLINKYQKS